MNGSQAQGQTKEPSMRVVLHGAGGPPECLELGRAAKPQPAAGEVLIRIAYAGVNRPDIGQRMGSYPPPAGASPIIGLEAAGIVESLGEGVTSFNRCRMPIDRSTRLLTLNNEWIAD